MASKVSKANVKPATKTVEVLLRLKVPAGMAEDEVEQRLMDLVDDLDPSHAGPGFWLDSHCSSVREVV